jgi:hypothetical protein
MDSVNRAAKNPIAKVTIVAAFTEACFVIFKGGRILLATSTAQVLRVLFAMDIDITPPFKIKAEKALRIFLIKAVSQRKYL